MILVDTGPLVALFDPRDPLHHRCRAALKDFKEPLWTTIPVLTEAFHILDPASLGARRLRDFLLEGGISLWFMDLPSVRRALELMERYADHPMDLADASVIAAAETLRTRKVFTVDRRDFLTYRIRLGNRQEPVQVIP